MKKSDKGPVVEDCQLTYKKLKRRVMDVYSQNGQLFFEDVRFWYLTTGRSGEVVDELESQYKKRFPLPSQELIQLRRRVAEWISRNRANLPAPVLHCLRTEFKFDSHNQLPIDLRALPDLALIRLYNTCISCPQDQECQKEENRNKNTRQ